MPGKSKNKWKGICPHFNADLCQLSTGSNKASQFHSSIQFEDEKVHVHFGNGFGKVWFCCMKYWLFAEYFWWTQNVSSDQSTSIQIVFLKCMVQAKEIRY